MWNEDCIFNQGNSVAAAAAEAAAVAAVFW